MIIFDVLNVRAFEFVPQLLANNVINKLIDISQIILDKLRLQRELINSVRLPNTQIISFDGDPLKYWPFIRSFDNFNECSKLDDNAKLVRLVQSCTKEARNVIET